MMMIMMTGMTNMTAAKTTVAEATPTTKGTEIKLH
jgi:hypothetical protein